eukprot:TRINITY_DN14832_c0_g1_i1.p2 TRINITY_DN14832_c0_g1~~TRINITY_DN14832_c0_g1_i1.p2  ORF type:complete len:161 (+),score=43.55 TRINITY_DN14832_c0_g1_i1:99-581(+)
MSAGLDPTAWLQARVMLLTPVSGTWGAPNDAALERVQKKTQAGGFDLAVTKNALMARVHLVPLPGVFRSAAPTEAMLSQKFNAFAKRLYDEKVFRATLVDYNLALRGAKTTEGAPVATPGIAYSDAEDPAVFLSVLEKAAAAHLNKMLHADGGAGAGPDI